MELRYVDVAAVEDIPLRRGRPVWVDGRGIALFRVGEAVHAIENSCPHAGSALSGGTLDGCLVQCPSHGLAFDVRTGCMRGGGLAVATYPVCVDDGRVRIGMVSKV